MRYLESTRSWGSVALTSLLLLGCGNSSGPTPGIAGNSGSANSQGIPDQMSPVPFDMARELRNFNKVFERQAEYTTPEYTAELARISAENLARALLITAQDPERSFLQGLCWHYGQPCAGDVRLYNWEASGAGIVEPVLFTARNGATLSGHVWRTRSGPAIRPGIVVTSGSAQATEANYWWGAQTLAKAGYVVLTYDVQGQGLSDTQGEAPDQNEGFPAQNTGTPFYDGTVDALDFLLSTPDNPYCPRPSTGTGTSHCAKQERRVTAGLNSGFNPYWNSLDPTRIGLTGHSYGAQGITFIGQQDLRVSAVVAWDNLCLPGETPDRIPIVDSLGGAQASQYCQVGFQPPVPAPRIPSLGISSDYFVARPQQQSPDPLERSFASRGFSRRGADTGQLVIRGGTHFEFCYLPDPAFTSSLRGIDLSAWYTAAWFDKYLKNDPSADARLLTTRWQHDRLGAEVDEEGDGNLFSFYLRSRMDVHLDDGTRWRCEDLRSGCPGQSQDTRLPADYRFLEEATRQETI